MTEPKKLNQGQARENEVVEAFHENVEMQDSMSLRIHVHSLGNPLDKLILAAGSGRQRDYDEFVFLPAAEFPQTGLVDMRTYVGDGVDLADQAIAGRANTHDVIGKVVDALRRGELAAATIKGQEKRWVDLARWAERDAGEIVRVGVLDGAEVYIVVDRNAAGLSAPPWEWEEWDPNPTSTLREWCFRPAVLREARRRALIEQPRNPSGAAHFRAMAAMWKEAQGRGCANPSIDGAWKTIEQDFVGSGFRVVDLAREAAS